MGEKGKPTDKLTTFLDDMAKVAKKSSTIKQELYKQYNVKRGLRNEDGSGVLVGLTNIGEVHGYVMDENEKIPVDGRLRYRGIGIKDFVAGFQKEKRHGFEEVAYLLLFGELPTSEQLVTFKEILAERRALPEGYVEDMILKHPSQNIMNKLARTVLVLYSYDKNPDSLQFKNVLRQCIDLIAKFPTIVVYGYQAKAHYYDGKSLFIHHPQEHLSTAENILYMLRPDSKYTKIEADLLDLALVLHAEHGGGNNSTFTAHLVSSSDTDTYSAIAAAIGSLKGFKHGGANIRVLDMMNDIKKNVKDIADEQEVTDYLIKIVQKKAFDRTGLIYGMGHAVYTASDPREVVLKAQAEKLAKEKGRTADFEFYKLVQRLAPIIFKEVKGSEKVISANVDFYSGFVYSMLDLPPDLFTPLFAVARITGWCAHRLEEIVSGGRIMRPAYKSVSNLGKYVAIGDRETTPSIRIDEHPIIREDIVKEEKDIAKDLVEQRLQAAEAAKRQQREKKEKKEE